MRISDSILDVCSSDLVKEELFYKQKTTDDVRISDWSSDVCSSDLLQPASGAVVDHRRLDSGGAESGRTVDGRRDVLERVGGGVSGVSRAEASGEGQGAGDTECRRAVPLLRGREAVVVAVVGVGGEDVVQAEVMRQSARLAADHRDGAEIGRAHV